MANYQLLKTDIDAKVYQNGAQEITGANLNSVLNAMVTTLGAGYQFIGMATPTNPGTAQTPDYKCFYIATTPGTYTNLGGLVVADGEVAILKWDTSWTKEVTGIATAESVSQLGQQVIYDVTKNNPTAGPNNDGQFESLSALLSDENLSTLIPIAVRCGGMSIRFVQTSDNKYVQYRYLSAYTTGSPNPFTNTLFWQKQGAEVSVKNSTSSTYKNARAFQIGTGDYNVEDEVATKLDLNVYGNIRFSYGEIIGLGVGVGNKVDLTPEPTANYRYALVPCKAGDIFLIAGIGGYNPRLWGFIDSSNILLEVAAAGLNSQGVTKTAPTNAAYLIINDNNSNRNCYRKNTLESDVSTLEKRTDDIETSLVAINEEIEENTEIIELSDSPFVLKHLYQGNLISNNNKNAVFENKVLALKGSTISVDSGYKYQYATYNITTKALIEQVAWKNTPTEIAYDCDIRIEISDINENVLSDTSISEHLHYKLYAKKQSVIELSIEEYNEIYESGLDIAEQADNLINVIGYSQFVGRVMKVAKPYKYSSWPMCLVVNNELVCAYTIGNSHNDNMYSAIYAKVSSNGVVWSAKKKIIDTFQERDGVTGKGNDTQGNALLLNRVGPFDAPWMYFELWKSNNGLDWECISKPTFATQVGHCGDIINVPSLGLVSFFNTYGSSRSWGYIVSEDDGVTWSQHIVESGLSATECPAEISAVYLGDGKILAMGRSESNDSTHQNMWQMQSSDNGITWSREQTNIYGVQNTPSILFDNASNQVTMYIMLRSSGNLVKYVKDADVIWNNPTSWGDATVISSGWATGSDVGNVNAVRLDGNDFVSFYSGTPTQTGIYVMIQ